MEFSRLFDRSGDEVFVIPKALIRSAGARIIGRDDPSNSMSKSLAENLNGHVVGLVAIADATGLGVMEEVTVSGAEPVFEHASRGIKNLLMIFQALSAIPRPIIEPHFEGRGYQNLRTGAADLIISALGPVRIKYLRLVNDPAFLTGCSKAGLRRCGCCVLYCRIGQENVRD